MIRDYAASRSAFRESAAHASRLESAPLEDDGHGFTVDTAWFTHPAADRALMVSSGLHGVEGPIGAKIQRRWMAAAAPTRPADTDVILIHALNPFGFHHGRRANAHNFDLNRAFFEDAERPATDPLCQQLAPVLYAEAKRSRLPFGLVATGLIARFGPQRLRNVIAGGQYDFPRGLFFGGTARPALQDWLEDHLLPQLHAYRQIEHVDIHTGLGRFGQLRLLMESGLAARRYQESVDRFGPGMVFPPQTDFGYRPRGSLAEWLQAKLPQLRYFCAEIGTDAPRRMLVALRDENRAWFDHGPDSQVHHQAAARLRERFDPDHAGWQETASQQVLDVLGRLVN